MPESRASTRAPAVVHRKPAAAARANATAVTARPVPATRNLQQRIGNSGTQALAARATTRSLSTPMPLVQTSLTVSQPGDPYEKEADSVADKVMRMPASQSLPAPDISAAPATAAPVRRACAECKQEMEEEHVQRQQADAAVPQVTPAVEANVRTLQSEGSPLPKATREFFEPRFGADFSQVRVNNGARANETANALGARAFTVGQSISFASGQYAPASQEGQRLLAHELTHVVQQDGGVRRAAVRRAVNNDVQTVSATPGPRLQPAWYNFDIPFTDYQFDPSIEGLKTAAGVVKDVAVDAVEWIVDQVRDLVNSGIQWLRDQWNALEASAMAAWNAAKRALTDIVKFFASPLTLLVDALMNLDADSITRAWNKLSTVIQSVADGFKAVVDKVLGGINKVWGVISGFATSLLNKLAGIVSSSIFRKLPDALQNIAKGLIDTLRSAWKWVSDKVTNLINEVRAWIDGALDLVFGFVRKVLGFGINVVIKGIVLFGQLVLFMQDLFRNPAKYLQILAEKTVKAFSGVEGFFGTVVAQHFGSAKAPAVTTAVKAGAPTATVHRAPDSKAAAEPRTSASWGDIGTGVWTVMGEKWDQFKANPMAVVWQLLKDMIFPLAGNIDDIIKLFKDIYHIVTGPLGASSLDEFWTSLLKILDIPVLIYHTVVSILMRSLMVPLIVASFIPHPLVKGIAAAVGYGLLGMFVESELLNVGHKLLLLKTGKTTGNEKKEAYNRIADSLIAFAMALAIALLMLLLHFLANVAKGIYGFVKGKVFGIDPAPVESKGPAPAEAKDTKPKTDEPAAKDLGTQNGKKVLAEEATADGKHEVKVTEEGIRCCSDLCKLMIEDIDANVKDNPALKEKLEPYRKRLETAQGKVEWARITEERAGTPQEREVAAKQLETAADEASKVGAEIKPEIEKIIHDEPLPSGLRFNEYPTPEGAMGMKEGSAEFVKSDPINNVESIREGYTTREYYRDPSGKQWSLDVRNVDGGGRAYRSGHGSSGQ